MGKSSFGWVSNYGMTNNTLLSLWTQLCWVELGWFGQWKLCRMTICHVMAYPLPPYLHNVIYGWSLIAYLIAFVYFKDFLVGLFHLHSFGSSLHCLRQVFYVLWRHPKTKPEIYGKPSQPQETIRTLHSSWDIPWNLKPGNSTNLLIHTTLTFLLINSLVF